MTGIQTGNRLGYKLLETDSDTDSDIARVTCQWQERLGYEGTRRGPSAGRAPPQAQQLALGRARHHHHPQRVPRRGQRRHLRAGAGVTRLHGCTAAGLGEGGGSGCTAPGQGWSRGGLQRGYGNAKRRARQVAEALCYARRAAEPGLGGTAEAALAAGLPGPLCVGKGGGRCVTVL